MCGRTWAPRSALYPTRRHASAWRRTSPRCRAGRRHRAMSEWWSYRLSDFLLFSPRTYHRLFELHNIALWPMHVAALALGASLLWAAWQGRARIAWALL